MCNSMYGLGCFFFFLYCYPVKGNVETVVEGSIWEDLEEKRKANCLHRKTEFKQCGVKLQ